MIARLKILQINKFYYLKGGSERYLFDLSKILEAAGQQVINFSMQDKRNRPSPYQEYFSQFIDLHSFNLKNILKIFYNWQAARRLEELIEKTKPDLAHLHNITYQLSPAVIRVLKRHNIPVIMTLHDYNIICPNAKLFTRGSPCQRCRGGRYYHCFLNKCSHGSYGQSFLAMLEAYFNQRLLKVYDQVDLFIAPSQAMKEACVKFGLARNKIINLCYPINLNDNNLENIDASNYILYFGRLAPEKGVDLLLEAMVKVNGKISLKIAGGGPDYQSIENQIKKLGLSQRVELLGEKYGDELSVLIKHALAVVVPSVWPENMPYSMLESLAMGKIVIASRIGGMSEIIKDGDNGWLFKSGDSHELVLKINLATVRNEFIKTMEKTAKNSLREFNIQDHYEKIRLLYGKILKF
ncbi:MAG: glycosyltransferase [bacterium]|nr:glycosyltransferase [bacterium]